MVWRNGSLRKPSKLLSTASSDQFLQLIKGLHVTSTVVPEVGHQGKGSGLEHRQLPHGSSGRGQGQARRVIFNLPTSSSATLQSCTRLGAGAATLQGPRRKKQG